MDEISSAVIKSATSLKRVYFQFENASKLAMSIYTCVYSFLFSSFPFFFTNLVYAGKRVQSYAGMKL